MALPILGIGSMIVDGVKGYFDHKSKVKQAKRDVEIEHIKAEAPIDSTSAGDMKTSWKDEFLTLWITSPVTLYFYAIIVDNQVMIGRVEEAFKAFKNLPVEYWYLVGGVVIGTFGLRTLAKLIK